MLVPPAAFAGLADYRAPDNHTADRAAQTKYYLGSEPTQVPTQVDLRSPDAKDLFVPAGHSKSPNATPPSSDNDVDWGTIGIIIASLALCGALAVVLRRHRDVGRPLGVLTATTAAQGTPPLR